MWRERAFAWPLRLAVLALVALPVAVFFHEAARGLGAASESGSGVLFTWALLGKSVGLAAMVALVAVAIGAPAGLVAGRLSRRWRMIALFVFVLPLAVPPSVHSYLWRNLAMSAGLLGVLFVEGGSDAVNVAGATVSLVSALWTIPALAAFAVAAGPGRRFELEARPFVPAGVAARKVLVPAARPVAAAAAGMVFILAFADYGGPAMWQITTYPVHIQALYSSFFEADRAAAAALVPAAVTGLLAALVYIAGKRAFSRFDVEQVNADPDILWRPGRGLKAALVCVMAALTGLPIALAAYWMVAARPQMVDVSASLGDLLSTLVIAAAAAAAASALAVAATGAHWPRFARWRAVFAVAALAAFVIPPAALGLAV
jgi:iron(III) transport system permease protein